MNGIRFLPSNDKRFPDWVDHFQAALAPLITAFDATVAVSENPQTRTTIAVRKHNEARAALKQL
jgi:hypothetical protein